MERESQVRIFWGLRENEYYLWNDKYKYRFIVFSLLRMFEYQPWVRYHVVTKMVVV